MNFLINTLLVLLILMVVGFVIMKINPNLFDNMLAKQFAKNRAAMKKEDGQLLGKRMKIQRKNDEPVSINLYLNDKEKSPALFICHGGTFMDGDADQIDTLCKRLSEDTECSIISINYTKLDEQKYPYQQHEVRDTILSFSQFAEKFDLDSKKFALIGFSAGGHIAAGASTLLKDMGFPLRGFLYIDPVIDDSMVLMAKNHLLPAKKAVILAGRDKVNERMDVYREALETDGETRIQIYQDAERGFIEYCNPEMIERLKINEEVLEEQKDFAMAGEIYIRSTVDWFFEDESGE